MIYWVGLQMGNVDNKKRFWNTITLLNLFLSVMICVFHNGGYVFYDDGSVSEPVKHIIDAVCS